MTYADRSSARGRAGNQADGGRGDRAELERCAGGRHLMPSRAERSWALKCGEWLVPRLSPLMRILTHCGMSSESCSTATRGTTA